jgi:alpha-L-fucosidase
MKNIFLAVSIFLLIPESLPAQSTPLVDPKIKTSREVLTGFMDLRFGMFIHWGPVALRGTEIGWSRGVQVAVSEYDSLYQEFNPVLFDSDKWVKTAKNAGMKYLVITAKHHDGFCLWPTSFTANNIMNTTYKKDIVGALAEACKKQGIRFCIYFTVLDWYDPNYPIHLPGGKVADPKSDMNKFVYTTMKGQLKELVTRYHPYMLWFDGNWDSVWTQTHAVDMYTYLKTLDPQVIINNRLGKGDHPNLTATSVGDYATPEQKIGALNMNDPWETCMTIGKQWSWKPNDNVKSAKECIQTLVKTAGGNGNLLFNVGPMLDGRIENRQVSRLKEIGDWLKLYGESIYGTKGGPYAPSDRFATTRKGNKLYVHVFANGLTELRLPGLTGIKVVSAQFIGGVKLPFTQESGGAIVLQMPAALPNENDSVIALTLESNAENIPLIEIK